MKPLACFLFGALFLMSCETSTPEPPPPPPPPPTDPTFEVIAKDPVAVSKQESTKLLVYYHTWFQTKEVDAYWGIRWRMNTKDPETILPDGRREIASHYYPAIGPYSSRDTLVLQLQSLWMKYSGIDGVSIDWYGTSAVIDYDILRGATETAMTQFANAGLSSHVVLQDKSIYNSMDITQSSDTLSKLTADFNYLKQLSQEPYWTRHNNAPVFMVKGPEFVRSPWTWDSAFTASSWSPETFVIQDHSGHVTGAGEYGWPWGGGGDHLSNLENFYKTRPDVEKIGAVYPGFRDYYTQGGWGGGVSWTIGMQSGATLEGLFNLAKDYTFPFVQITTWNNYNEGTMVEPTLEEGTVLLEKIIDYAGAPYDSTDLNRCQRWYEATLAAEDEVDQKMCRQIYYELISLNTQRADELFDLLEE